MRGGWPSYAMDYARDTGLVNDKDYPYTGVRGLAELQQSQLQNTKLNLINHVQLPRRTMLDYSVKDH